MASTYRLQEQITGMMLGGATLRKAALWLYALSCVDSGADHQAQATSYLTSRG